MNFVAGALGLTSTFTGIMGAFGQSNIDEQQVELQYKDTIEKIRRREFTQDVTKGKAKAFSENAGVLHSGGSTAQGTLDTMSREFKKELDWMKHYANRAKSMGLKSAKLDFQSNLMSGISSGVNTMASAYGG